MLRQIQTLLKTLTQFFIQKPSREGNWQWVWDDASGQAIKHDSNPWLTYYASSPQNTNNRSTSSVKTSERSSNWDTQKLMEFSADKSQGFLPGLLNRLSNRKPSPQTPGNSDWNSQKLIEFSEDKSRGFLPGINQKIDRR